MTPFEIDVLLHYYMRPIADHAVMAYDKSWARDRFLAEGLLERAKYTYTTYQLTERGIAYCEALQRVPLPIQKWVQPEEAHNV